jgi:hypothetical protein
MAGVMSGETRLMLAIRTRTERRRRMTKLWGAVGDGMATDGPGWLKGCRKKG